MTNRSPRMNEPGWTFLKDPREGIPDVPVVIRPDPSIRSLVRAYQEELQSKPAHQGVHPLSLGRGRSDRNRTRREAHEAYRQAMCAIENGNAHKAVEAMITCLRAAPAHGYYHFAMAMLLERMNLIAEARGQMEWAVLFEPEDPYYRARYATLCLQLGLLDEAAAALRQALRLQPGNTAYHYVLGDTYRRLGLDDMATHHYNSAGLLDAYDARFVRWVRERLAETPAEI